MAAIQGEGEENSHEDCNVSELGELEGMGMEEEKEGGRRGGEIGTEVLWLEKW